MWKEIQTHFSFEPPGAKFSPAAKKGHWDGRIYLAKKGMLYAGLKNELIKFAHSLEYEVIDNTSKLNLEMTYSQAIDLIEQFKIPFDFEKRDYQINAMAHGLMNHRALFLSPTGSGKSMIIYYMIRGFQSRINKCRTLLVVPTANLLLQMSTDMQSYGYDKENIGQYGDSQKDDSKDITIATWQSIYNNDKEWFNQFDMVIIDEAHLASAKSLKGIMENCLCQLKFGFTGTLNGTKTHQMVLEGLFGPVKRVATTKELIDNGTLAPFNIKAIKLNHPIEARKWLKKHGPKYPEEMTYLVGNPARNRFLARLALSLEGNTLLLFHRVEEHGKALYDLIRKQEPNRPVFYIHGKIKAEEREIIRKQMELLPNAILVASYGTLSTGVNIKRLDNLIFGSPWKSQIINLQSIGRVLRPMKGKTATLYDISDDLSWKTRINHTLKHFIERLKIFNAEEFEYRLYNVELRYKEETQ